MLRRSDTSFRILPINKFSAFVFLILFIGGITVLQQKETLRDITRHIHKKISSFQSPGPTDNETAELGKANKHTDRASNATLGFEKIFAINLPSRSDRRDALTLVGAYQDIELDWWDASIGSDLARQDWPPNWSSDKHRMSELGCWRSHLDVIRHIVENRYATALIIEDDMDWDVRLKIQTSLLAQNLQRIPATDRLSLRQQATNEPLSSPYGSSWDILRIGTFANPDPPPGNISYQDPVSQRTRYVWEFTNILPGTGAYAVTYESAKALSEYLLDIDEPYDFRVSTFCETHKCFVTDPNLMAHHEAVGSVAKSTDVQTQDSDDPNQFRETADTPGIRNSAILSMLRQVSASADWYEELHDDASRPHAG